MSVADALKFGRRAYEFGREQADWEPPPEANEWSPLPESPEDLEEQAKKLGLTGSHVRKAAKTLKGQLFQHLNDSHKIDRCMNKASIVLVGDSGVGKSSTINHLFGQKLAEESDSISETRETKEYKLVGDDDEYKVKDLSLSIIDTPGFNDTGGESQDSCNVSCIEEFFEEFHDQKKGKKCLYPNMVLFLVESTNARVEGDNSSFSKGIRIANNLGLIDQKKPNVIIILTKIQYIFDEDEWEEKLNKMESRVKSVLKKEANILAPVVCIENKRKKNLPKEGEFTKLENGDLQPKNLYHQIAKCLKKNKDGLGHMAVNFCFADPQKVVCKEGLTKHAGIRYPKGGLNSRQRDALKFLRKNVKSGEQISEVSTMIESFCNGLEHPISQVKLLSFFYDFWKMSSRTILFFTG